MNATARFAAALAVAASVLFWPAAANTGVSEIPAELRAAIGTSGNVRTAGFGASVTLGPCTLYPTAIHRRTSRPGFIGSKPYTRCKVRVTSMHQETELVYEWFAWWKQALNESGGNSNERNYTQRGVEFKCQGTGSTVWAGSTAGTVVYQGHTYYAKVWQKQVRLPCGA